MTNLKPIDTDYLKPADPSKALPVDPAPSGPCSFEGFKTCPECHNFAKRRRRCETCVGEGFVGFNL